MKTHDDDDDAQPRDLSPQQRAALGRLAPAERAGLWRAALALHRSNRCFFVVAADPRPTTARELVACGATCLVCDRPAREDDFAEPLGWAP